MNYLVSYNIIQFLCPQKKKNPRPILLVITFFFWKVVIITYKVVGFLDMRKYTTSYTDHPQELINIITGVANETCKVRHQNKVPFFLGISQHTRQKLPPKTTSTYFTSKELKISQAAFSGEDMAVPTVAMCVLFHVLLSTMTVRLAIAVVWYP